MPRRTSKICRYASLFKLVIVAALCAAANTFAFADDGPLAKSNPAILHLAGDAHVTGQLRPSDDPKTLSWQSPEFAQPFNFLLEAIKGVHYPAPSSPPQPKGEFCFELAGGDLLFGSLISLSDDEAELDSPRFGRLRLRRDHIRSLYRWNVSELVYLGPNGAAGFKEPSGAKDWVEEAGQLMTDRRGATMFGDLGIPERAVIELELSWKAKPDFSLALAVGENAAPVDRAFRFDVLWRPQAAVAMLMADARHGKPVEWEYTFRDPGRNWFQPASPSGEREAHKPGGWRVGPAGFGTHDTPGAIVRTEWSTDEIWLRRSFHVHDETKRIALSVHHDEDVRVWINGKLVHSQDGFRSNYIVIPLDRAGKILKKGENTIAVYCRQTGGGQYIDVGIVDQGTPMQGDLVAVRETDREADLASVQRVTSGGGRTHLLVYVDQPLGRMIVSTPDGNTLADLKLPPPKPHAAGGLRLTNHDGDLRLERLRISRWNGVLPRDVQSVFTKKARLHRGDGSIVYGELVAVDGDAKQFVVRDGKDEVRVASDQIASVFLSPSSPSDLGPPRTFRAVYQDGTQLSGELRGVGDGHLRLANSCFQEPLRLPLDAMRSLVVLKRAEPAPRPASEGTPGLLEIESLRLPGRLASGPQQPTASPLLWQPDHSLTASPLQPGVTGRITYRQPSAPMPKRPRSPLAVRPRRSAGLADTVLSMFRRDLPDLPAGARRSLHLRNGDVFPCELSRIDEKGLTFKSPLSDAAFVAHQHVKAVELVLAESPPKLNKAKWDRFLTLPRMQTPSPPTHLIRSKDGDFLRGRLMSLDEKTLKVEVRAEVKEFPRDRVSHIIWLHADELSPPKPGQPASPAPSSSPPVKRGDLRVQVRQSDGNRLTFKPERFAGNSLSGISPILGACRADVSGVDEILIGAAIDQAKTDVAYHRWKLHRAIEPKFIQALAEPGPKVITPGTEAALVGKPAPDFELQLLDDKKFRLANSKGRVVVLDFWATWCGPCLQLMPRLEQVVGEFKDHKVELIAINLEEPASQITSLLQRYKLQTTVALDRDGVVAAKYEATAIPYTVVIDQNGKVARLFVGGGPHVADHLRDALRELLFAPKTKR